MLGFNFLPSVSPVPTTRFLREKLICEAPAILEWNLQLVMHIATLRPEIVDDITKVGHAQIYYQRIVL